MSLPPPLAEVVSEESRILEQVLTSLREQRGEVAARHAIESERAQALTSEIVATRRAEEKAMLASDEAVSHALRDKGKGDLATLNRLLDKPYFARFVVEEEVTSGSGAPTRKRFEYRLGVAANPECRIVDWRRAPISALYYEYREGDDYSEMIQGRERNGTIALRHSVDIAKGVLRRVSCRHGTAVRVWRAGQANGNPLSAEWEVGGPATRTADRPLERLPSILALITPEQFRAITEEARTAVLIQGSAGSGKTTVALHRLAWLLHEDNSPLKEDECAVIVLHSALKSYITHSLDALEIREVPVATFGEWAATILSQSADHLVDTRGERPLLRRPTDLAPHSIERLKRSTAMLQALERYAALPVVQERTSPKLDQIIVEVLERPQLIRSFDDTKLIDDALIASARERALRNLSEGTLDSCDDALVVRLHQVLIGEVALLSTRLNPHAGGRRGVYRHLVVDEVQDFGAAELACVIEAVEELSGLTIVGDVQQQLGGGSFPGWERLRTHWESGDSMSRYLSLTVSHRTTREIMLLAAHISSGGTSRAGGAELATRHGRVPIWFRARLESEGIPAALQWLKTAVERYPTSITAVICRDRTEAKYVHSLLHPTFGAAARLGSENAFSFEEGILVSDVAQVKGLEFTNVLLWNPSAKSYPAGDEHRNALYVGVTRAEENLAIVTWGTASSHLPNPFGKLVRLYEMAREETEEGDRA